MAIKVSNQITLTELKKIIKINEYYTTTQMPELQGNEVWSTDVPLMSKDNKYLWNYEETEYSLGDPELTDPVIIGVYGEAGASLQIKYISSATVPTIVNNNISAWSDQIPSLVDGERIYMTQKMSTDVNWSTPIPISAVDGKDGSANVEINDDGYWVINGEITGVKAEGEAGKAPEITIGQNGNWYIDGFDSGTKAQGEAGKDGSDVEYVYYRSKNETQLSAPSYNADGTLTTGWTASPQGITETYKCEYVSVRTKPVDGSWGNFSTPVLWSRWGEKGQDGDGVEYKYYLSNSSTPPTSYSTEDSKWTDDPSGVTKDNQYEYVVQIKTNNGSTIISEPSLWAKYGENGVGISEIVNYYQVTQNTNVPTSWQDSMDGLELSPTNKYLWNYEEIIYTDGSSITTDPAIIGAYGDSGTDAVDFQIYSVNGFEFSQSITSIELKTVATKGGDVISSGATYQWFWWNSGSTLDDKYEIISDAKSSALTINVDDLYALAGIKCVMTYDGIIYEDYVSLTQKVDIYTATTKFFNGNNVIASDNEYVIMYVELYKNNTPEEQILSDKAYVSEQNVIQDNIITTDIEGTYTDESLMYFVCKQTSDDTLKYDVVLGKYMSGVWEVVKPNYIYNNDLFSHSTSNVLFIPKEKVSKSLNINFEVCNEHTIIARTSAIVFDLNDPMVSADEPTNPKVGQLWLDTSVSPSVLKMWDGTQWVNSGYQNGGAIYTSKPEQYSKGDLWILADDEVCGEYGPGTMLKATESSTSFDESHWIDAMAESTEVLNNVKQYFLFNKETGLRIGQQDEKFYVNISATEMGFYDNSDSENPDQKVVSIGNKSAVIKNIIVEDSAEFNCASTFNNQININGTDSNNTNVSFVWQIESNGSLSLAIGM